MEKHYSSYFSGGNEINQSYNLYGHYKRKRIDKKRFIKGKFFQVYPLNAVLIFLI